MNRNKKVACCLILIVFISFLNSASIFAEEMPKGDKKCKSTFPNLITDICWKCVFPIRIGGKSIFNWGGIPDNIESITGNADDFNPSEYICTCKDSDGRNRFGIYVSFWEPDKVLEVTPKPWCFSFLFGLDLKGQGLPAPYGTRGGKIGGSNTGQKASFYNVHLIKVPLLSIMDILVGADFCTDYFMELDLMYFTEIDPVWNYDYLGTYLHPEAILFGNPIAQALCAADCLATSVGYPLNPLFWCAGCWGGMYPFTGHINTVGSPIRQTSLAAARLLNRLARLPVPPAMELDTSSSVAKCGGVVRPILKKSQYRFTTLFPIPETKGKCCHGLGASTFLWGEWRNVPGIGEYHTYLIFRKRNCCLIII